MKAFIVLFALTASQAALASDVVFYCGQGREAHESDQAEVALHFEGNGAYQSLLFKGVQQDGITSAQKGGAILVTLADQATTYTFSGHCDDGDTAKVTKSVNGEKAGKLPCQCDED